MLVEGDKLGGLGIGSVGVGEGEPRAAAMVAPHLLVAGDGEETRRRGRRDGVAPQPRRPLAVASSQVVAVAVVAYRARRRRGGREEEEREGGKRGHRIGGGNGRDRDKKKQQRLPKAFCRRNSRVETRRPW